MVMVGRKSNSWDTCLLLVQVLVWSSSLSTTVPQLFTIPYCISSRGRVLDFHRLHSRFICPPYFSCMDASIAIKPVFDHYSTVVITSAVSAAGAEVMALTVGCLNVCYPLDTVSTWHVSSPASISASAAQFVRHQPDPSLCLPTGSDFSGLAFTWILTCFLHCRRWLAGVMIRCQWRPSLSRGLTEVMLQGCCFWSESVEQSPPASSCCEELWESPCGTVWCGARRNGLLLPKLWVYG